MAWKWHRGIYSSRDAIGQSSALVRFSLGPGTAKAAAMAKVLATLILKPELDLCPRLPSALLLSSSML
jgi:hypothetical protein